MGLVRLALALAALLAITACASSGAVPRPFPRPTAPVAPDEPGSAAPAGFDSSALVETALSFRGVAYRNGGSDPSGFDCSGLVQYAFARHGIALPREVREQAQSGRLLSLAGIEAGDLIFFATMNGQVSHVGIAIGSDEFVHAPSSRGVVRVEKFSEPYWSSRIVSVRRIP